MVHIPKVLYHWRAAAGSTALALDEKPYAKAASLKALQEHLGRTGYEATVATVPNAPYFRVTPSMRGREPKVSLVIPAGETAPTFCVSACGPSSNAPTTSTMRSSSWTTARRSRRQFALFDKPDRENHISILACPGPFNYSRINNSAVEVATGQVTGLVNIDIKVISPGWLREMLSWAVQDDIGCVGAKLHYSDDSIEHAGVIVGLGGVAGHSHKRSDRHNKGYFGHLVGAQELSAVTAACLMVRKSVYEAVGGLDEDLTVAFNDVDFCLKKIQKAGYHKVFTP